MFGYSKKIINLLQHGFYDPGAVNYRITDIYNLTAEDIPELIRLAIDISLLNIGFEESLEGNYNADLQFCWGNVNAWNALTELKARAAIEPLFSLFSSDFHPTTFEYLPPLFLSFGFKTTLNKLNKYLNYDIFSSFGYTLYVEILKGFADKSLKNSIIVMDEFYQILNDYENNEPALNSSISRALIEFNVYEAFPLIAKSYLENFLDDNFNLQVFFARIALRKTISDDETAKTLIDLRNEVAENIFQKNKLKGTSIFDPSYLDFHHYDPSNGLQSLLLSWIFSTSSKSDYQKKVNLFRLLIKSAGIDLLNAQTIEEIELQSEQDSPEQSTIEPWLHLLNAGLGRLDLDFEKTDLSEDEDIFIIKTVLFWTTLLDHSEPHNREYQFICCLGIVSAYFRAEAGQITGEFADYQLEFLGYLKNFNERSDRDSVNLILELADTTDEKRRRVLEIFRKFIISEILLMIYSSLVLCGQNDVSLPE